jgi:ribosomal-protein-alanine N-acetyltransferase
MTWELRTERLVLRPVEEDDLDVLLAIRNAPDVVSTTGTGKELPRETMAGQLSRRCASWRDHGLGSWVVLLDQTTVGYVEVAPIGEGSGVDPEEIEIGVVVHPDHWGRGIAVEAGLAAARDLVERTGRERVYASVDPGNAKSLRAMAKAPGARKIDDELYELSAAAVSARPR